MKRKLFLVAVAAMVGLSLNAQSWTPQAPANGDFYLYNVGTGKFLSCGEDWGTHAVVGNGALKFTLANNGSGAYTLFTTSTFSYGNPNSAQLQSSGYVDQSVTATTWTFTEVGGQANTYTLQNAAGTYLYAPNDGTIKIQLKSDAPSDNYGYWKLINLEHLYDNARLDNPIDVTCLIGDANFESSKTSEFGWTMVASNQNLCGGASPNKCAESYRSLFTLSKVLDGVPNGEYELTAQGFYRQDGSDNTHLPVFYINEQTATFPVRTGREGSMDAASASFTNGLYTIDPIRVTVGDGRITLGAKLEGNTMLWCIFDNFTLKYYGIDLSAYEAQISSLRSSLSALIEQPMKATVLSTANTALTETESVAYNQGAMEAAIAQLNTAISAVNTSIANYAAAKVYLDKASTLDATGQATYSANETVVAVQEAYDNASLEALTAEQKSAMDAAIIVAAKAQTTPGSDWTYVIVNPSFENGFSSGWTNNGMDIQNNTSFDKDGSNYCEKWQPNGTVGVSQTLSAMPSGVYRLTVKAKTRGVTSAKVYAGGIEVPTKIADEVNTYTVEFACDNNADVVIGFQGVGTGAGSSWLALDDFHLTLVSAGLPDVVAVTGKMNNDVAAAQTSAINRYNENKTVANYNAASAAIAAAQASKEAYSMANAAITKANDIKTNDNFASGDAIATFADAIANVSDAYDNGTLTNEQAAAAGTTLGTGVTGWRDGNNTPAAVYLRDGFALGDFAPDPALHVNTWSTEGDNDGTGFSVPFYESWTGDANNLPESTLTSATLTGLPNGQYKISAWVRVRTKNGVAATDATGITMDVNGGDAVDVTEGSQIGTSQFTIGTYEAYGLVKQGNLSFNFNIADGANISWLSFQKVKYTKVRDLTPEEAFVPATDEDYSALNDAILAGEAKTLGFDEGDYAPYNNIEAIALLAAAKAIDQDAENAQEDVQAATTALTGATWTANAEELNAVYDGTFAAATNDGAPAGWTMSDNTLGGSYHARAFALTSGMTNYDNLEAFGQGDGTRSAFYIRFDGTNSSQGSWYNYGKTDGYKMPLKASTKYYITLQAGAWGDYANKNLSVTIKDASSTNVVATTLKITKKTSSGQGVDELTYVFETNEAGDYTLSLWNQNGSNYAAIVSNIELKKATPATMAISDAQYATFVAPFAVTIPDGVTAYTVTGRSGNTLVMDEVTTTISANTPVILFKEEALAATTFYGKSIDGTPSTGWLTGVYAATPAPDGSYVLQNNDSKIGFYKVNHEVAQPTVGANRCYLTVPAGVKANAFFFNDATGIQNVLENLQAGEIYDISGRKLGKLQKGVNIVNGKKVLVK